MAGLLARGDGEGSERGKGRRRRPSRRSRRWTRLGCIGRSHYINCWVHFWFEIPFMVKCVVLEPRFWLGIGSLNKYLCICPNLDDGGQRDNISSSKCEARNDVGGLGAAREARKEAKREKQRTKKLVRAAKSLVPPRWMEKSRSAHEGVALSKGAHSFRWGINRIKSIKIPRKICLSLGFPERKTGKQ